MRSSQISPEVRPSFGQLAVEVSLEIHGRPVCVQMTAPDVPTRLVDVVPPAQALADKIVECVSRSAPEPITCRKGCAACCRYLVPLSAPEALAILDRIDRAPPGRRREFRRRFLRAAEKLTSSLADDGRRLSRCDPQGLSRWYHSLAMDCPFLEGDICCLSPQAFPMVSYWRVCGKVIIGIR